MKNILIIGSGGLRVGQAGEFDYSGSQAIKAFKSEGHRVVLANPNIATVQTDKSMADKIYFVPLQLAELTKIIQEEKIDLLALGFGGQTALNLGLELFHSGALSGIEILGSSIKSIEATEDRSIFRDTLNQNNIATPVSKTATSLEEAVLLAADIGYPLMLRSGFSLGGLGSGKVQNEAELINMVSQVLTVSPQVLLEEYLTGWKEFEYEVVRDKYGNALTICSMENLDPMGIHTGESIVIAPAQTLNDQEHQNLRNIALDCAKIFQIIGECNIQFAINPVNGDYRVIEMNPRLSRSSALASKVTGYPLAYIAAKLCLGYALHELENQITKKTSAFFEPALDYVAVKMPRWDMHKLREASRIIGTEMKSVGEVMGIGRSFAEALQKAIQMLNVGASGISDYTPDIIDLPDAIEHATDSRIFALYRWFAAGYSVDTANSLSKIDKWFLHQIKEIASFAHDFANMELNYTNLLAAKRYGFSDIELSRIRKCTEAQMRDLRLKLKVQPVVKQIDSVACEFSAATNYLYLTYHGKYNDVMSSNDDSLCILGSGPYAIGTSVEFDWCTVNLARELRAQGKKIIVINSNPETVSTDYDESDRLYFEPLTLERVADILDFEQAAGVIVSVGGQIANNLALPLAQMNYSILGTTAQDINRAEDRQIFSQLLQDNNIDQPRWISASNLDKLTEFVREVGFPVMIRPSYVLSGAAMKIAYNSHSLAEYLSQVIPVSKQVVVSEFIQDANEIEVDGVASHGCVIISTIAQHVEHAGVHSGDSVLIFPAQTLSPSIVQQIKDITRKVVANLNIHGPFNMQFLEKNQVLKVIECNVRSSRSFPFVSKVSGCNLIELTAKILLNKPIKHIPDYENLAIIGVKTPVFSYNRFKGSDPVAQLEMSSTGEVACIGTNLLETFYKSWMAADQSIKRKSILLSANKLVSNALSQQLVNLIDAGWLIFATHDSYASLSPYILDLVPAYDTHGLINRQEVGLVINIPEDIYSPQVNKVELTMRRSAIDYHIPLVTNLQVAKLLLASLYTNYVDEYII